MPATKLGAAKTAARRIGTTLDTYLEKRGAGMGWCSRCRQWLPAEQFHPDRTRGGLKCRCVPCSRAEGREYREACR